ncbi:MAG: LLM class flavin-dependent oxidoreductase [Promethearchaeota archaeon]|nr:MAG: LLM class flavin-dependent oxidoreductase [Candidatus Lokiarchaeota archaeon]
MKYGAFINPSLSYEEIRKYALRVEDLGFDSIHTPDHFVANNKRDTHWEAMTLMTALAVETSKIKIGHIILSNSFRHPALLAKMICTLDHISNGRALLWFGGGWKKSEYIQYGYPFPKAGVRVSQMEEALTIIKKMFTEEKTSFEGRFWTLKRNFNYPKPIQKPYPQIVLGTITGKRVTDIACREADGLNFQYNVKIADIPHRVSVIKENLKKYNRDLSDFEISILYPIMLVESQEELDEMKNNFPTIYSVDMVFTGFPEDLKEKFAQLEDLGVKKIITMALIGPDYEDPLKHQDRLELFAKKVM